MTIKKITRKKALANFKDDMARYHSYNNDKIMSIL